jgi:hypothetical protein
MGMLEHRIKGWTLQEIADEYRCSIDTVQRHLDWGAREGNILKHEETILERLMPKAIKAYEKALDAEVPDIFVAKDLMAHLMKMSERVEKRTEHVEELSLNAWLKTRKATDVGRHATDSESADPLYAARTGDEQVRGDAAQGPAEVGETSGREQLPAIPASAGRADGETGVHVVDGEIVDSEDGTKDGAA